MGLLLGSDGRDQGMIRIERWIPTWETTTISKKYESNTASHRYKGYGSEHCERNPLLKCDIRSHARGDSTTLCTHGDSMTLLGTRHKEA